MSYSFWKTFKKGLIGFILFAIPFILTNFPQFTNLTIGAILVMFLNFMKQNTSVGNYL